MNGTPELLLILDVTFKAVSIFGFIGGGLAIFLRMSKMSGRFEEIGEQQAEEISELKATVKTIGELMLAQARTDTQLVGLREILIMTGKRVDELTSRFNTYMDKRVIGG